MVRASKPTTPNATSAAAPVVAAKTGDAAAAPVATATKKAAAPKAPKNKVVDTANPIEVSAAAAAAAAAAADTTAVVSDSENSPASSEFNCEETIGYKMTAFNNNLQQLSVLLANIKTQYKALEKFVSKEVKASQKASSKKMKRSGNRQPSGFVRPTLISDELAAFLGKPAGSEMARTDVSKEINNYIRSNSLQDKTNGRQINADAKLTGLLKLTPEDVLTYFNLQKFMKIHFCKIDPAVAAAAAPIAV